VTVLADALLRHLRANDPGVTGVEALRAVTTGASQEIWTFDALRNDAPEALVLRRARNWSESSQAMSAGMSAEAALLRVAAAHGVPVPRVVSELREHEGLGQGYVMQHVVGETAGHRIVRDPALVAARPHLLADCAHLLARLHSVPVVELPPLREGQARDELRHWAQSYRANGVARPVFELAIRWLEAHLPEPVAPLLVHGDFRNGNLVVGPEGVRAVLDWELAHRGDPMEDLGWFCVNAWRFGAVENAAGGFGSRDELFRAYESAGGAAVDAGRVRFWEVLGNLKWGVACDAMGLAWRRGIDRSIERLAIGRRVSEVELDLLQLMAPRARISAADESPPSEQPTPPPSSMLEIVGAARAVLERADGSGAEAQPRADFEHRVALRLLGLVQRELAHGEALEETERAGLRAWVSDVNAPCGLLRAHLCRRIAEGDPGLHDPALHDHLWRVALARLAIDNPNYRW
jgi:aminoglycoside phosphotransferase (APT) family kinase protein